MSVIGSMVTTTVGTVDGLNSSWTQPGGEATLTIGAGSPIANLGSVMVPASTSGPAIYWDNASYDLYVATTVGQWAKYAAES